MRSRWILAAGLAAIGLIWIGQGLGLLRGSGFMDGDVRWAVAGAVLLIGGVLLGVITLRGALAALSQPVQLASARPTVTSRPHRTSGSFAARVSWSRSVPKTWMTGCAGA